MSLALEQVVAAANEIFEDNGYDDNRYELRDDGVYMHYKEFIGNGKWRDMETLIGNEIKDVINSMCEIWYDTGFQNG